MFLFTVFVFGFVSAFRSLEKYRSSWLFAPTSLPKIGRVLFILFSFIVFTAVNAQTLALFLMCVFVFGTAQLPRIMMWWQLRMFERHKIQVLSHIILNMKSGNSLRAAFSGVLKEFEQQNSVLTPILRLLAESLVLGQTSAALACHRSTREFAVELIKAEKSSHHCLVRIQNLRVLYQKQFDFRRRSGQVLAQIRAQALVLCGLYLAMLIFVSSIYGSGKYLVMRFFSGGAFVLGLFMIFYLGRKVTWTV